MTAATGKSEKMHTIEQLRAKHRTSLILFAGVRAMQGWSPGKSVTETAYLAAIENFKKYPSREGD